MAPLPGVGVRYIPIHGTWAGSRNHAGDEWWQLGSPFWRFMRERAFGPVQPGDPYKWSGELNGAAGVLHRLLGKPPGDVEDWYAAADALRWYLERIPFDDRNLIAHSHGDKPVILAATHPIKPIVIRTLITVGSPVRKDFLEAAHRARLHIRAWLHVFDAKFDKFASLGAFNDGAFDWWWNPKSRLQPAADVNVPVPEIGHSGVLSNPELFPLWQTHGWLRFLATGER